MKRIPPNIGRPQFKDNADRISLTLSAPARAYLMEQAKKRAISRTQVVEELISQHKEEMKSARHRKK